MYWMRAVSKIRVNITTRFCRKSRVPFLKKLLKIQNSKHYFRLLSYLYTKLFVLWHKMKLLTNWISGNSSLWRICHSNIVAGLVMQCMNSPRTMKKDWRFRPFSCMFLGLTFLWNTTVWQNLLIVTRISCHVMKRSWNPCAASQTGWIWRRSPLI